MSDNEETILNPPCEFGRFIVERELGHGGMGGVFLARDKMLDRQVALKVMLKSLGEDPQFLERFKREAQAAARLLPLRRYTPTTSLMGSRISPWKWRAAVRFCV